MEIGDTVLTYQMHPSIILNIRLWADLVDVLSTGSNAPRWNGKPMGFSVSPSDIRTCRSILTEQTLAYFEYIEKA